ncbi:DDE-type integrase/transposase/recombinase [Shimia sp. MIT910701]|uniref:DDE-type integrase/transposase/recombinase n=1 Tax=Shimia sp. MIT910701 TaxID=3096987 RepID=UPI00399BC906
MNDERYYLWRAVDHEGEVLESYVPLARDRERALKFAKKSIPRYGRLTRNRQSPRLRSCDERGWQLG